MSERTVTLYGAEGDPRRPVIYMPEGTGDKLAEAYELTEKGFILAAVGGFDWDAELSPWPAPPVFKKGSPFGGGAEKSLAELSELARGLERDRGLTPVKRGVAGYSLGGLFALYAALNCDFFTLCASVSGSLWFPGWDGYISENAHRARGARIYLSLGDLEGKTRNPVMAKVDENFEITSRLLREAGAEVTAEYNPGNHFADVPKRIAVALDSLMK